jgi:hypothetical protein
MVENQSQSMRRCSGSLRETHATAGLGAELSKKCDIKFLFDVVQTRTLIVA